MKKRLLQKENNIGIVLLGVLGVRLVVTVLLLPLLLHVNIALADDNSRDLGNHVLYYNALTTDSLSAKIAKHYGIDRSRKQAMLNVSLVSKEKHGLGSPVAANITGVATNLNQQLRQLVFREIREGAAVYYITVFPVSNNEAIRFDLAVSIFGSSDKKKHELSFEHQFYTGS